MLNGNNEMHQDLHTKRRISNYMIVSGSCGWGLITSKSGCGAAGRALGLSDKTPGDMDGHVPAGCVYMLHPYFSNPLFLSRAVTTRPCSSLYKCICMVTPAPPPPPLPPPWDVVALADVAPTNDADVGVTSDGEVFFRAPGATFAITVVAPLTGTYDVTLEARAGSHYFFPSRTSLCTHGLIDRPGNTNSFSVCSQQNSACQSFLLGAGVAYDYPTNKFDLQAGENTLWLRGREACSLARQLIFTPPPSQKVHQFCSLRAHAHGHAH